MIRLQSFNKQTKACSYFNFKTKIEACEFAVECIQTGADWVFMYDFNGFGVFDKNDDPDNWSRVIYKYNFPCNCVNQ
jgi:hypothetical protein